MKRLITLMLTLALMMTLTPALAAGADIRANLPDDIRNFFSTSTFRGYTIHEDAVEIFENTIGGSFAFAVATKGSSHILYGFEWKNNKWQYWLKNSALLLNSKDPYWLQNCKGTTDLPTQQTYTTDSLMIILCPQDLDYYTHVQVFTVNEYGQWHLKSVSSYLLSENDITDAWVEKDRIQYFDEESFKSTTVWGTVETNLRYCNIDAFPATVKEARQVLTSPPRIPGNSQLSATRVKFTGGQKFEVYTGPGSSYERAGNGKAIVSTNDWIQVFGHENGYILIQYDITADQMRFGYITDTALPANAQASPLAFDPADAEITANTFLTDDPLNSQTRIRSLYAGQQGVKWLATMGDWVYVEVGGSGKALRGFVPAYSISRILPAQSYSGSYANGIYTAEATVSLSSSNALQADIHVTAPATWYYQQSSDPITGYQLYANNMPVYAPSEAKLLSTSSAWNCTFSLSAVLPTGVSVIGLCPVRASGQKAKETIILSLR